MPRYRFTRIVKHTTTVQYDQYIHSLLFSLIFTTSQTIEESDKRNCKQELNKLQVLEQIIVPSKIMKQSRVNTSNLNEVGEVIQF